ncbi:MAG: undecaprenyl/decaprenyl-phosphate alpha-N-acetylglucosaminyl 1-phosphate transferase [Bacteroidetes bacterium]|nr:undecaprenyl/decaprenyl-phosphate alpha-N-acetylglucosaminyl 1-phosphate transferase [Bacteroidota bacterium]MBS1973583.1 undecaprenyl/decaprenyl-phosphate alpha-N-acetylglucosaminyl 1-phosphate transferase [Bacteroidota bacterium]
MFDVLLSVVIAFTITFLAIPVIINVAEMKKLYDVPDGDRKIHHAPITPLGGIAVFAGFAFGCLLTIHFEQSFEFQYFIAAALIIFFLGLKDDILIISAIKKFIGQVLAAFMIIYYGGIQIKSMHGFLGIYQLPEMFSLLLTYFAVIVIINSFNLIDGVDGLAGSLGLMALTIFGFYFYSVNMISYSILAFSLAGSLLAFLIFNFQPAKIFMGDTGSLLIGAVCAILSIKFISAAGSTDAFNSSSAAPAIAFTVLMIPLLDTLRVFAIRIFYRRSPFSPDRNHIHHILLDRGFSHRSITILLVSINLALVALVYYARTLGCTILIFSVIAIFFAIIGLLHTIKIKHTLTIARATAASTADNGELKPASKIVSFINENMLEQKN